LFVSSIKRLLLTLKLNSVNINHEFNSLIKFVHFIFR